jgi:hypothetical protein
MDTGSLVFLLATLGAIAAVGLPLALAARRRRGHSTESPTRETGNDVTK